MKHLLTLAITLLTLNPLFAQNSNTESNKIESKTSHNYAYLIVNGYGFGKKINVKVDLGDTREQIKLAQEYTSKLDKRTSIAAILNFMSEQGYELVEIKDVIDILNGSGGSSGFKVIMKKKKA